MLRHIIRVSPTGGTTHLVLLRMTIRGGSFRRIVGVYRPNMRTAPRTLRFCFCLTVTCDRTRHGSRMLTVYRGTLTGTAGSDGGRILSSFCSVVNSICRGGTVVARTCDTCSSTLICGPSGVNTLGGCTCCLSMRHQRLSGTRRVDCGAIGTSPNGTACLSACT